MTSDEYFSFRKLQTKYLVLRKLQKERKATDDEMVEFLDQANAGNSVFEAVYDQAMIGVRLAPRLAQG